MLHTQEDIRYHRQWLGGKASEIKAKVDLNFLLSDPTRMKIIYLMKKRSKLCVSDVAKVLDLTVSAVSHQFSALSAAGLVKATKSGKQCYYVAEKILKI